MIIDDISLLKFDAIQHALSRATTGSNWCWSLHSHLAPNGTEGEAVDAPATNLHRFVATHHTAHRALTVQILFNTVALLNNQN